MIRGEQLNEEGEIYRESDGGGLFVLLLLLLLLVL